MLILEFAGALAVIWIGAVVLVIAARAVFILVGDTLGAIRRYWRYFKHGEVT